MKNEVKKELSKVEMRISFEKFFTFRFWKENEMEILKFFCMCLLVANAGYDAGKCLWRLLSMR